MAAVVLAALILLVPPRMSSGTKTAFCELFGGKNCDKQSSSSPAAGNPSSGPSGGPPSLPGTPEQAAYDKAKRDADTANTEASNAEKEFEGLKDELWSFLKDLIGITEAEKCIKDFDIMACIETAANAIPWGKAFKLLRKLPKAFKLAGRFKNIWDKVSAARKKRDDAQRALKKAEDDLRKKKEADRQKQAGEDPKKKPSCPLPRRAPNDANSRHLRRIASGTIGEAGVPLAQATTPPPSDDDLCLTEHAKQRLKDRHVTMEEARKVLTQTPFSYWHEDQWKTGYWDPELQIFIGKTIDGNINTIIDPADRQYIENLKSRRPGGGGGKKKGRR
ncbi:hypothetical protein [Spirillospora sp. CA-294931]|uniref:hypothetical protein n=1 Tax=Spirillospora sp. CA-294931 TaxID=3240042 RepID=UPI003D8A0E09